MLGKCKEPGMMATADPMHLTLTVSALPIPNQGSILLLTFRIPELIVLVAPWCLFYCFDTKILYSTDRSNNKRKGDAREKASGFVLVSMNGAKLALLVMR
jgi:hypothetical protein